MATVLVPPTIDRRRERHDLVRHFAEMVAAMIVGMAVLGMVARGICAALGHPDVLNDHAALRAPVMALDMTIGMAVWMRYRSHRWAPIAEMSCAMFAPLAVLIVPYSLGAISANALLVAMHALMLPAMAVAMLHRRDDYAHEHHAHGHHEGHATRAAALDGGRLSTYPTSGSPVSRSTRPNTRTD